MCAALCYNLWFLFQCTCKIFLYLRNPLNDFEYLYTNTSECLLFYLYQSIIKDYRQLEVKEWTVTCKLKGKMPANKIRSFHFIIAIFNPQLCLIQLQIRTKISSRHNPIKYCSTLSTHLADMQKIFQKLKQDQNTFVTKSTRQNKTCSLHSQQLTDLGDIGQCKSLVMI